MLAAARQTQFHFAKLHKRCRKFLRARQRSRSRIRCARATSFSIGPITARLCRSFVGSHALIFALDSGVYSNGFARTRTPCARAICSDDLQDLEVTSVLKNRDSSFRSE